MVRLLRALALLLGFGWWCGCRSRMALSHTAVGRRWRRFEACVQLAMEGCRMVAGRMRQELLEHTKRLAVAKGAVRL